MRSAVIRNTFGLGLEKVIPAATGEETTVKVLVPVPKLAVIVSKSGTPADVTGLSEVAASDIGGFTVIRSGKLWVPETASVAVSVSKRIRETVELADVKVLARVIVAWLFEFETVTPGFEPVSAKDLFPEPSDAVNVLVVIATPCVVTNS